MCTYLVSKACPTPRVAGVVIFAALLCCGCSSINPSEKVIKQAETMDSDYLAGSGEQARSVLRAEVALLEGSKDVLPKRQAAVLFIASARLFVLERRIGNDTAAELAFVKVRYWDLRRYELNGPITSTQLAEYKSHTPEKLTEIIDNADKAINQGRGPKYMDLR